MRISNNNLSSVEYAAKQEDLKVLIVNDDAGLLMILETIFKSTLRVKAKNIQRATNGQEAYDMAIQQQFDLIVMDLNMPIMGGYEATKKIKDYFVDPSNILQLPDFAKKVPYIIALSATEYTEEDIKKCKESRFDDQFISPLSA